MKKLIMATVFFALAIVAPLSVMAQVSINRGRPEGGHERGEEERR